MRRTSWLGGVLFVCFVAGCGIDDHAGLATEYVAPAGSDAELVSHTMPTTLFPGERRVVEVVMRNTGATPGTNDWTTSSYRLQSLGSPFGWPHTFVPSLTAVGAEATFRFVITAPTTPGGYTFTARMYAPTGNFGDTVTVPVMVDGAVTPHWNCTFVPGSSSIPTTLGPGENATVTVVVQNTGTQTWPASGQYLFSTDAPVNLWAHTGTTLTSSVAPGATATFTFGIKAPATPGSYQLRRQMRDTRPIATGAVGFFRASHCVDATITVGGASALDAALVSQDFPVTMAPGESRSVTVTMQNTGSETWLADGNYALGSQNSPSNLWGVTLRSVSSPTAAGSSATFTLTITAPTTPGSYNHRWQMRKLSGASAGFFGPIIDVPVVVDGAALAELDASVVSQMIPTLVSAGTTTSFQITMQNDGSGTWSGTDFGLFTTNTPSNLWGVTQVTLGAAESVPTGGTRTFTFNVTAPATPGTYESRWRMRRVSVAYFGDEAITTGIEVTLCGNGTIDAGEACDDSNLTSGDGCSSACTIEAIDLATDTADRTLLGSSSGRLMAAVGVGDLTGDGAAEVVVGETHSPPGVTFRSTAGAVYGYPGGAAFFTSGSTQAPTGAGFTISGAESGDQLAGNQVARIVVADVVGDAIPDLIVSAAGADGPSNARTNAGEVYIFTGGAALLTAGIIDLGAVTPPVQLTATIVGATAGDGLLVLAVGDVTGDAVADLVLGAPNDDTNGTDAGAVYVVSGAGGFSGTIDLASPGRPVFRILGAAAGDKLGLHGAVGDFGSTAIADILLGTNPHSPGGRTNAGAAWGVFGPVSGDANLAAGGADVRWFGVANFDRFGSSVAIGNALGSAGGDVIIGALQWQRTPGVQVGAVTVFAGPVAPGTYDLSGAATPDAILLGADQYDSYGATLGVGDLDGDGFVDIGAIAYAADGPGNARASAGETQIIAGGVALTGTIDLATAIPLMFVYGAASLDFMGNHHSSVSFGDVNNDGRVDWCVGSHRGGSGGGLTNPGRVDCFQSPF